MIHKKSLSILGALILMGLGLFILINYNVFFPDPTIKTLHNLSASNITSIEMVTMPSDEDSRYKQFDPSEFAEVVTLLQGASGRFVANPEPLSGGATTFYIVEDNGDKHEIINSGNTYLSIDGKTFDSDYGWLSEWSHFQTDSSMPLMLDYEKTDSEMTRLEAQLQAFKAIPIGTKKSDIYEAFGHPMAYTNNQLGEIYEVGYQTVTIFYNHDGSTDNKSQNEAKVIEVKTLE